MTEAEWLACDVPGHMIRSICRWKGHTVYELGRAIGLLGQNRTERRYRLFACACLREVWHHIQNSAQHRAVELAELYADGEVLLADLRAAREWLHESAGTRAIERLILSLPLDVSTTLPAAAVGVAKPDARLAAYGALAVATDFLASESLDDLRRPGLLLSNIFRDIFGNPFRLVTFAPEWRNGTAVALARQVYQSRDFAAMPVLADALQDAGCDNDDVLDHCRGPGPHVRGCWALDLVLGRDRPWPGANGWPETI